MIRQTRRLLLHLRKLPYPVGIRKVKLAHRAGWEGKCRHWSAQIVYEKLIRAGVDVSRCADCGKEASWKRRLSVHHKDGNWHNEKIKNAVVLCHRCHMDRHFFNLAVSIFEDSKEVRVK